MWDTQVEVRGLLAPINSLHLLNFRVQSHVVRFGGKLLYPNWAILPVPSLGVSVVVACLFVFLFYFIFTSVTLWIYVVYMWVHWGQKRASDLLELGLPVAVNHVMWVLRNKLRSSGRAALIGSAFLKCAFIAINSLSTISAVFCQYRHIVFLFLIILRNLNFSFNFFTTLVVQSS